MNFNPNKLQHNLVNYNIKNYACEVNNWYSVEYDSFSKVWTPDDGRLRAKHVVKGESEGINGCIVTDVIIVCKVQ
jgi:hypothetical protein